MIVDAGRNLNRKSFSIPIALCELALACLLIFFPDWAKAFLFGLPLVLFFGEAIELIYNFFKKKASVFSLIGGIIFASAGTVLAFCGRRTYMVGIAVLMLFETGRIFIYSRRADIKAVEKLIYICASILSLCWMFLILFKGLHLYWSVREYLAMYFFGTACISIFRKR